VNGTQTLHRFQLHYNSTLDKKIEPISAFQLRLFVYNWHCFLALDSQVPELKLVKEALFIRRFEQART
jgi:hypothetical protein